MAELVERAQQAVQPVRDARLLKRRLAVHSPACAQTPQLSCVSLHSPSTWLISCLLLHALHVFGHWASITGASPQALRLARASDAQSGRSSTHVRRLGSYGTSRAARSACSRSAASGGISSQSLSTLVTLAGTLAGGFSGVTGSSDGHDAAQSASMNDGFFSHSPLAAQAAQFSCLSAPLGSRGGAFFTFGGVSARGGARSVLVLFIVL